MASLNPPQGSGQGAAAAPARQAENLHADRRNAFADAPLAARPVGYGMPCAKCKTYYAANLTACPVCKATERVEIMAAIKTNIIVSDEKISDPAALEEERERFLREFESKAYAASLQLGPTASSHCVREENHRGTIEPAT